MTTNASEPLKLFYCYAHEDKALRDELDAHLAIMKRQKLLEVWYDRQIMPGTKWEQVIDKNLTSAHIILLLVSAPFLNSDYCYGIEMQKALQRDAEGIARVVPIILRPVDWEDAPFSTLQVLPAGAKPVTRWADRDDAFEDIARELRKVVKELRISLKTKEDLLLEEGDDAPMNLTRVITNIDIPLSSSTAASNNDLEDEIFLLGSILVQAKQKHKLELSGLIPYLQFILKTSERVVVPAKRYAFVDDYFAILLSDSNEQILTQLSMNAEDWPSKLADAWKEYEQRQAEQALAGFRSALYEGKVVALANEYKHIPSRFQKVLQPSELELAQRAIVFANAYKDSDDEAFLQALTNVQATEYVKSGKQLYYPLPAVDRWRAIKQSQLEGAKSEQSSLVQVKKDKVVANIYGIDILFSTFQSVLLLKEAYTAFRVSTLRSELSNVHTENEKEQKNQELQALKKIQKSKQFHLATLNDLVAEILIESLLDRKETKQCREEATTLLPSIIEGFKKYSNVYDMIQEHKLSDTQLQDILRVFVLREAFLRCEYQKNVNVEAIEVWIDGQKRADGNTINYTDIGLEPPKGPTSLGRVIQKLAGS